ncbi:hypothetical protein NE237_017496 [Protea cynaroides]|uniref:Uncharacterized protein n=1 Tax=Protea cynaroides TaxID=273540 RepID=A0A9Q0K862_9MAGN|nr:hypothetical protein NE237_017496 [Protea cynaroides]
MMAEKKMFPSLPSNYVTLQQLQDRRLKEQLQRQKEKEEEEQRRKLLQEQRQKEKEEEEQRRKFLQEQRQKEKEEEEEQRRKLLQEQRLKEEQEKGRQQEEEERKLHQTQKPHAIEPKAYGRSNRGNPRNFSERKRWLHKEIGHEMQKGEGRFLALGIAADGGISDEGQKPDESKQHKGKKKTMTRETEEKPEAGVLEQSQAENGHEGNQISVEPKVENKRLNRRKKNKKKLEPKMKEEEAPTGIVEEEEPGNGHGQRNKVDWDEEPGTVRRIHGGIRQRNKGLSGKAAARASAVKKDNDNITATVVEKLEDLPVADHHQQKEDQNHGGSIAVRAGSGSHRGAPMIGRDRCSGHQPLMWVKKGETSDGSGIQKSSPDGLRPFRRSPH